MYRLGVEMKLRIKIFVVLPVFFLCIPAFSQTDVGRISGTITDSSGGRVPHAVVTCINQATKRQTKATADGTGFYLVPNLPVGIYNVEVEAPSFRKAEKTGFDLVDDGRLTADFTLTVGA